MGACNSCAKLQQIMDREVEKAGCSGFAVAYCDDLLFWFYTAAEHIKHVRWVMHMLYSCGLHAHPIKRPTCADDLEFISINVGPYGLSPSKSKVLAFRSMQAPANLKDAQHILGFINFYRMWLLHFSASSGPLRVRRCGTA